MACARDENYQNENGILTNTVPQNRCRKYKPILPSFTPSIYNLSKYSCNYNEYAIIYITGSNFLPPVYGTTYVTFGNANTNLPIVFYSSFNISFVVPYNVSKGNYKINVINIYNDNFSPAINTSSGGVLNESNSVYFTII